MEALKEIQTRFFKDFPPHPKEQVYGFATPSTMKPTQWTCKFSEKKMRKKKKHLYLVIFQNHLNFFSPFISDPGGGINQIPLDCTISGDVRLTPFYK